MLLKSLDVAHKFDYPLFNEVNFELEKGSSMSIQGISGCGKSTLLHICSSLLKPDNGKIIYNNKSLYSLKYDDMLKIRREEFGIIFQSHYLFKGFSAKENIDLAKVLVKNSNDTKQLTDNLGISHILNQKIGELSGGQQQRVSVARVLAKKPKIIFADEPTGNLDQNTAKEVMDILFKYIKENNAGLILVTHDSFLAQTCDKAYKISEYRLVEL